MRNLSFLALLGTTALAGCTTVGPDYHGVPAVAGAAAMRGAFLRGGSDAVSQEPAARWWEALGDPVLNTLIDKALAESPNVAAANARIAQTRAGLAANRTALLPTVSVSSAAPYINVPGGLLSSNGQTGGRDEINVYNVGFDASWELDLFGGTRRKIEAASARAEAAEASAADAQVTLSGEITRTYVGLRGRQAVLALMDRQDAVDAQLVALAQQRLEAGTAPEQALNQLRTQRAQGQADRAKAQADAVVLMDQIAVLTGQEPGALDATLGLVAPVPLPPASIAVGDPARLLRERPDIRAAERQLAAASADIGVQVANRFPKISFTGLLGIGGSHIGDIFDPSSIIGLALPQIKWSLFDGGRTAAQIRSAKGSYAEAEAKYRGAVLGALQDAEGALTRFGGQRISLGKALEGEAQAARAVVLQQQRAKAGTAGRSDALTAERQRLQLAMSAAGAQVELTSGFVAVEKALGLGWNAAPQPDQNTPEARK
jgi:NodT family efflux transporter outer membrane factor (OMF) lipoprotein